MIEWSRLHVSPAVRRYIQLTFEMHLRFVLALARLVRGRRRAFERMFSGVEAIVDFESCRLIIKDDKNALNSAGDVLGL